LPEPPEDLLAAVRDEAEARVRMDVQAVAKHLTPEAVDTLRASFPGASPRLASYEIEKDESRGGDYVFDVRYSARDVSFVVRSRWRKLEDGWMVIHAERLSAESDKNSGILSRLVGSLLRALGR
jgi:hypothetical protein